MNLVVSLILLGLFASLEPVSVIAFVVVLATEKGTKNGVAFVFGWIACVMVLLVVAAGFGVNSSFEPGQTAQLVAAAIEVVLGLLLVAFGYHRFRHPRPPSTDTESGLARRVAGISVPGAFVFGALIQSWPVTIAAATEIARANLPIGQGIAAAALYAAASVTTFTIMLVLSVRRPEATRDRLNRLRTWIDTHRGRVGMWAALIVGLYMIANGGFSLVTNW